MRRNFQSFHGRVSVNGPAFLLLMILAISPSLTSPTFSPSAALALYGDAFSNVKQIEGKEWGHILNSELYELRCGFLTLPSLLYLILSCRISP